MRQQMLIETNRLSSNMKNKIDKKMIHICFYEVYQVFSLSVGSTQLNDNYYGYKNRFSLCVNTWDGK